MKSQPCHSKMPNWSGSEAVAPAHQPGLPTGDELAGRHVERVEANMQRLALEGVELGVDHDPAPLTGVQILHHPVVFVMVGKEIGPKAAAGAGRDAAPLEDGDGQQAKIAAVADQAALGRAGEVQRSRVQLQQARQLLLHGAQADLGLFAFLGGIDLVVGDPVNVRHQALHGLHQVGDGKGQRIEQAGIGPGVAHRAGAGIELCQGFGHGYVILSYPQL